MKTHYPFVSISTFPNSSNNKMKITKIVLILFLLRKYRKARRKEKDGDQNSNDTKLYLEESVLERKLTDANLNTIIELPAGLDYNEWLASHSKYCNSISYQI